VSLSFLLDEDLSYRVAEGLRQRGVEAVSVHEIGRGNKRILDEDQLAYATARGRVLVTYNRADYQALDAQWRIQERTHAGVLWCSEQSIPRRAIGDLIRALEAAAQQYDTLHALCLPLQRPAP
jgi:predicted nuclease of predicted toxin-antitoxin system